MSWTKAQHVQAGTWWDGEGETPPEVLEARQRHGLSPNGSELPQMIEVAYCDQLYDVARSALTNPRAFGVAVGDGDEYTKLETSGPATASGTGQADETDETDENATKGFKVSKVKA